LRDRYRARASPSFAATRDAAARLEQSGSGRGVGVQSIGDGDFSVQEAAELVKVVAGFSQTVVTG
jgi:hypothetical protein